MTNTDFRHETIKQVQSIFSAFPAGLKLAGCCNTNTWFLVVKGLLVVGRGAAWCHGRLLKATAGSGCVCRNVESWGAEGLRLGAVGLRRGRGGKGGGKWGRGRERPKWEKGPAQLITGKALCQMLTSNYLGSHHIVPAGKSKSNWLNMYNLFDTKTMRDIHF